MSEKQPYLTDISNKTLVWVSLHRAASLLLVAILVIGCGSGSEELVVVVRVTGCVYDGPTEIAAGDHNLVISPSGGGRLVAEVHRLDEGFGLSDVTAHYSSGSSSPPVFTTPFGSAERLNEQTLARESLTLSAGEYVVVCVTMFGSANEVALPVAAVTVIDSN